ncbi:sensor domain-containing diguanylate cyclase [Oceanobacillus damuensis]|uniref:sensor domain-containing diguanylate cyclase n=1 Tax=Oceanobacillus damuensis TaxID=937928 RepID=UPI00082A4C8D|nr:GGDEF domain-containing protein [Oceanobacillus damuensis]
MHSDDILQGMVQQSYFTLLSRIMNNNYNKTEILLLILEKMKAFLHTDEAVVYYYEDIYDTYQLLGPKSSANFNLEIVPKREFTEKDFFNSKQEDRKTKTFQYTTGNQEKLLFVFSLPSAAFPAEAVFNRIEKQTESLLMMINQFQDEKRGNLFYRELFLLSKEIFTTNDMSQILTSILECLKRNNTGIDYRFLLSQDVEVSKSLPIVSIEYSNNGIERLSTKAFLTGELQVENKPEKNLTYIYAPLTGKQGVYGVLEIHTPLSAHIPELENQFLTNFAKLAGKAIEAATLFQNSKHQVTDLTIVNDLSQQLNSNLELPEIVSLLKTQIQTTCETVDIGFFKFYEGDPVVLSGSENFFETMEGRRFMEYLHEKSKAYTEPVFSGNLSAGNALFPYHSVMAFPMIQAGIQLGLVVILHKKSYFFSFDQYKLIQAIIQHSTLAMANTILKDKLQQAVITDYLTGLYSRSYLEETIQRHMQEGEKGVLILFDIDDFKKINDNYGHHIGDRVLIQVASTIMSNMDGENTAARWGGEEMAIYAPNMDLEEGYRLAEDVSMQVKRTTNPTVTMSTGISEWKENERDLIKLFMRSDKALYEAKKNGKNRVIIN